MKKIAILTVDLKRLGGTQRVAVILANELNRYYESTLITLYGSNKIYEIDENIKICNLNKEAIRLRYSALKNLFYLKNIINDNEIEILIVMGRICTFIPLLLKYFCRIRIIFCEHASRYEYTFFKETFKSKVIRKIFNYLVDKKADKVVFLTNREMELYKDYNKAVVIQNPIDEKLLEITQNYNIKAQKIITVGRIEYGKGIDILVKVAKIVFQKHPEWKWDVFGSGDKIYIKKINKQIENAGLSNNLFLRGEENDIYNIYRNYSFFVFTSRFEALPMVLLEAKANKLPIISFDINSGPSDIITNNIDGFLIKPFDYEKMADKVCELIENPNLRIKYSQKTYSNINKFRKDIIIRKWQDLIEGLHNFDKK